MSLVAHPNSYLRYINEHYIAVSDALASVIYYGKYTQLGLILPLFPLLILAEVIQNVPSFLIHHLSLENP